MTAGLQLPREPRRGEPIDAAWAVGIVRYLRAITPTGGGPITVSFTTAGAVISLGRTRSPGSTDNLAVQPFPFEVVDASSAGAAKVSVTFGQVNSITPKIGGTALDAATPPLLTVITGVVYLNCTLDTAGVVTAVVVANAATQPANTATHGYITLANVTVASNAITALSQAVSYSLQCRRCGVSDIHFWAV